VSRVLVDAKAWAALCRAATMEDDAARALVHHRREVGGRDPADLIDHLNVARGEILKAAHALVVKGFEGVTDK
jgi:hypothetical protein